MSGGLLSAANPSLKTVAEASSVLDRWNRFNLGVSKRWLLLLLMTNGLTELCEPSDCFSKRERRA